MRSLLREGVSAYPRSWWRAEKLLIGVCFFGFHYNIWDLNQKPGKYHLCFLFSFRKISYSGKIKLPMTVMSSITQQKATKKTSITANQEELELRVRGGTSRRPETLSIESRAIGFIGADKIDYSKVVQLSFPEWAPPMWMCVRVCVSLLLSTVNCTFISMCFWVCLPAKKNHLIVPVLVFSHQICLQMTKIDATEMKP